MLCDSFTVETKIKEGNPIKFEAYKNLKSYFYFYNNSCDSIESGTTISLHLREDVVKEVEFAFLVKQIEKYFKFIDIPICVKYGEKEKTIIKQEFNLDIKKYLMNKVKYAKRNEINEYEFLEVYINNDDYEGVCGLIFKKNESFEYESIYVSTLFDNYYNKEDILICQNGITIQEINSNEYHYHFNLFRNIVGKINIKKKLKLNLSRNRFNDYYIGDIIKEFEKELFKKYISIINEYNPSESYMLYHKFIKAYTESLFSYSLSEMTSFVLNNIYLKVLKGNRIKYNFISEIIHESEKFIIVSDKQLKTNDKLKFLKTKYNIHTIIIENDNELVNSYFDIFWKENYEISLVDGEIEPILVINTSNKTQNKVKLGYNLVLPLNNELLFNEISYHITLYNINHPLIKLFINYSDRIDEDKIYECLKMIRNLHTQRRLKEYTMKDINDYIHDEFTKELNERIKITIEDFPQRFRGGIEE